MIQITDTLTDPMNNPVEGAEIRVTALDNMASLKGLVGSVLTDGSGGYSFSLVQGQHRIEVLLKDEYLLTGEVEIDINTPSLLTLPELLTTYVITVV